MGNCMQSLAGDIFNEKAVEFVRVMRADGKVLEFRAPVSVDDLLNGHEGYTVVHPDPVHEPLRADCKLIPGEVYYLLPADQSNDGSCLQGRPISIPAIVSMSDFNRSEDADDCSSEHASDPGRTKFASAVKNKESGAVRLKVVITKQQLAALLAKDPTDKISALENLLVRLPAVAREPTSTARNCGWRPALERIAEGCDV